MAKRSTSLFFRLIVMFLILIIPLEVCHTLIYNWTYDTVRKDTIASASSNVRFTRQEFETSVRLLSSQLAYLMDNSWVKDYLTFHGTMTHVEYYETVRDIERLLFFLHHSNPLIAQVSMSYPTLGRIITSENKIRLLPEGEMQETLASFRSQGKLLYEREAGTLCMGYMLPLSYYDTDRIPLYYLEAQLNTDQILSVLSAFDIEGGRYTGMINHGNSTLYMNGAGKELAETLLSRFPAAGDAAVHTDEITADGARQLAIICYSSYLDCSFVQLVPVDTIFAFPMRLQRYTLVFTLLMLLAVVFYYFELARTVRRPIRDLTHAFSEATRGNFSTRLTGHYIREYDVLAEGYNQMTDRIVDLIQENYESTIRTQRAELKQLYSQINPHFLYNTFFILRHSIKSGTTEHAERLTGYLGNYFRYMTDHSRDVLDLGAEYDHAMNYLRIQLMRFDGFVQADVSFLPEQYKNLPVPRLILQPILENAIEHGVPTRKDGALIRLRFREEGSLLRIQLDDSGDALTDEQINSLARSLVEPTEQEEQHALVNTNRRIQIYYGAPCGLMVERSDLGGLRVTMTLRRDGRKGAVENA